jgi:hypothetical protein
VNVHTGTLLAAQAGGMVGFGYVFGVKGQGLCVSERANAGR